jgi:hypothetical protein
MPEMVLPSVDGVTTTITCTIRYPNPRYPATEPNPDTYTTAVSLKLYPLGGLRYPTNLTEANADFYASYATPELFVEAVNLMLRTAWIQVVNDGGSPSYNECPWLSYQPGSKTYKYTAFPLSKWRDYRDSSTTPVYQLWFNNAAYPILKGFTLGGDRGVISGFVPGCPSPRVYNVLFFNQGANIAPLPVPPNRNVADQTTVSVSTEQAAATALPTVDTLRVLADLPSVGEFIPTDSENETAAILTDFKLDTTQTLGPVNVLYNTGLADARWIKLVGTAPISALNIRVSTVDTYGNEQRLKLRGPGDTFDMKLAFAVNKIVESS